MWIQETLPVDVVDEAVFRALNWFLPTYFNIRREEVQQTVIYEISNKRGKMRGQYWIFLGSSGNAIHRMYWFSKNLVARKGFLMVIDDEIRKLLRQRISFGLLVPLEVFQVNLYLAVDGQYGKDLPIELVGKSLGSNAELIANVVDRLDKSGLVELTTEDHICLTSEGVEGTRVLIDENMANLLTKESKDIYKHTSREGGVIRLDHTSGSLQPGPYITDDIGKLAIENANKDSQTLAGLIASGAIQPINETDKPVDFKPSWYPKKDRTRKKWAIAFYEVIQHLREEYANRYAIGDTEKPKPDVYDLRDGLIYHGKTKDYCPRRIRQITHAGDAGWLSDYRPP